MDEYRGNGFCPLCENRNMGRAVDGSYVADVCHACGARFEGLMHGRGRVYQWRVTRAGDPDLQPAR